MSSKKKHKYIDHNFENRLVKSFEASFENRLVKAVEKGVAGALKSFGADPENPTRNAERFPFS